MAKIDLGDPVYAPKRPENYTPPRGGTGIRASGPTASEMESWANIAATMDRVNWNHAGLTDTKAKACRIRDTALEMLDKAIHQLAAAPPKEENSK